MSDVFSGGDAGEPDFDDPAHTPISELLAAARVDTPVPADVAARLDATLASLTGQPRAEEPAAEAHPLVVPLRRRSRWAPRLLAAAAVVAVVGVGAVGLREVLPAGSDSDSKAAPATPADAAGGLTDKDARESAPPASGEAAKNLLSAGRDVPVLTAADFTEGPVSLRLKAATRLERVVKLADGLTSFSASGDATSVVPGPGAGAIPRSPLDSSYRDNPQNRSGDLASLWRAAAQARACTPPGIAGTTSYPVVFDGKAAVLVVHRPVADVRLVQAWSCDGSEVLAFTTVPA